MHLATEKNTIKIAQLLLEHGADGTIRTNKWQFNPLDIALNEDYTEMIELLSKHKYKDLYSAKNSSENNNEL